MSKEIVIRLRDDIDGVLDDDVATRTFSFDGVDYEIELNTANFEDFRLGIKRWLVAAREVRPERKKATSKDSPERAASRKIRDWARENGYQVGTVGAISDEVRVAYGKAHPKGGKGS